MPIGIVDAEGTLIYYNEQAEGILNQRFDETGDMKAEQWTAYFAVSDLARNPIAVEEWPLVQAYKDRRAVSRVVWLRCRDEAWRNVSFTSFPLIGQNGGFLGAIAIFWEI
jgi:PAS domain-containing protein